MSILLQVITVAIGALTLVTLIDVAVSARALRDSYVPTYQALRTLPRTSSWDGQVPVGGEAVWVFRSGKWVLTDKSRCRTGYEPGPPPTFKGEFEGHSVRQPCRRRA